MLLEGFGFAAFFLGRGLVPLPAPHARRLGRRPLAPERLRWVGWGQLYLFTGMYLSTVTTGGLDSAIDDLGDVGKLLPLIGGLVMLLAGVLFICLHLCPCYRGCLNGPALTCPGRGPG
jgi:hypothetical protein